MNSGGPKVGFVSLGCPKALVDSERILTQLRTDGYDLSPDYEGADVVGHPGAGRRDEVGDREVGLAITAAQLLAAAIAPTLGTEFLPTMDEGSIVVQPFQLPSVSLPQALETVQRIEAALIELPEVVHVVSRTGRSDISSDPMGVGESDTYVRLRPRSEWTTAGSSPRPRCGPRTRARDVSRRGVPRRRGQVCNLPLRGHVPWSPRRGGTVVVRVGVLVGAGSGSVGAG